MSPNIIEQIFAKLYGVPSWAVREGYASSLTLEFGNPHQEILPVINREPNRPFSHPTRQVSVKGDWHLWIDCCSWRITQDGRLLATAESSRESIAAACGVLDGQALSEFTFKPERGASAFRFDLGGKLTTLPFDFDDDLLEEWYLFCPDGYVLSYRSDGAFSHARSDSTGGEFGRIDAA